MVLSESEMELSEEDFGKIVSEEQSVIESGD